MKTEVYDVAVIGGGPAGSRTAAVLAGLGCRVLLVEKRERIGYPVRCAEAVGPREEIERYLALDESLVSAEVNGFSIRIPSGRTMRADMEGIGLVLDRELFDRRLAERAVESGAEVRTGHQATGLILEGARIRGLHIADLAAGRSYDVAAAVTVGADGVEALSPRWAGIADSLAPGEIFSCAQELIEGIDLPEGPIIEFHLGRRFAPGGYAWVFPKGERTANVGVGLNPCLAEGMTALEYLDSFIADRCPGGGRRRLVVGGCSVARGLPSLVADGYIAVGEAGHQNNPFSGGGIVNALEGADMAAEAIANALAKGDPSAEALAAYTRSWKRSVGRSNAAFYLAARVFFNLTDREMDRVIGRVSRIPGVFERRGVKPLRMTVGIVTAYPRLLFRTLVIACGASPHRRRCAGERHRV